jgi:hypothetical protein
MSIAGVLNGKEEEGQGEEREEVKAGLTNQWALLVSYPCASAGQ